MSFRGINMGQPRYAGTYRMGGTGAGHSPAANDVILTPFILLVRSIFTRISVTVQLGTGNQEMAVYNDTFLQLATSGVAAQSTNMASIGNLALVPGRYWLAYVASAGGSQVYGGPSSGFAKKQAGAGLPLPVQLNPIDALATDTAPRIMVYV